MYHDAKKILPCLTIIALATQIKLLLGKRVRGRYKEENKSKHVSKIGEDICISDHCIESTYNKLELPPSHPSHVRLNLEVIEIMHNKYCQIINNKTRILYFYVF